jgi:predicted transport protein
MTTFTKYKPKSEKELHEIIQKEIEELEKGLTVLKYEFAYGRGTPDFLCVDSGKRLTIIEVKLVEDENILFQALRYFSEIDKYRYVISSLFPENVDPRQSTRIILIAESFSDDVKRLSTLVKPDVELYEYTALVTKNRERGIVFHPVPLPVVDERLVRPNTINDLLQYLTDEALREMVDKIRNQIKEIGKEIMEYPTQGYIGYKIRGRQFAYLSIHRKSFDLGAHIVDENMQLLNYEPMRIEDPSDDYGETLEKIKKSFSNLGGTLSE